MIQIRKAAPQDLVRIAEIEVFNYRMSFYPIFQNDAFYFEEMQVPKRMEAYCHCLSSIWVYDDGVVKGFIQTEGRQVKKLFVEPVLQGQGIGSRLLEHVMLHANARYLWALEKNTRAIAFYERHGFHLTGEKQREEGTAEYLVRLERKT